MKALLLMLLCAAGFAHSAMTSSEIKATLALAKWMRRNWKLGRPTIYLTTDGDDDDELREALKEEVSAQQAPLLKMLWSPARDAASEAAFSVVTDPGWRPPEETLRGAWLIPDAVAIAPHVNLRYDSRVFKFSIDRGNITLLEAYVTKAGSKEQVTNAVGTWDASASVFAHSRKEHHYIWERRSDLRLQPLVGVYVDNFPPLSHRNEAGLPDGLCRSDFWLLIAMLI